MPYKKSKKKESILNEELKELESSIKRKNAIFVFMFIILVIICYFSVVNYKNFQQEDVGGVFDTQEGLDEVEEEIEELVPDISIEVDMTKEYFDEKVEEENDRVIINVTRGIVNRVLTNTFEPMKVIISKEDIVEWLVLDKRRHKISCYLIKDNWRVFMSDNFYSGEKIETRFKEPGEYLCIDMIYGARGYITVR